MQPISRLPLPFANQWALGQATIADSCVKRTKELQRLPVLGPNLRVLCLWVSYPFPPPNCWPSCVRTVRCEYLNLIPSACCDFAATVGYEESPGSAYESNEHRGLVKHEGWDEVTSVPTSRNLESRIGTNQHTSAKRAPTEPDARSGCV